ncbi:hypothetical protein Golomagni_03813 [Golovinomyces magnicellulatus]|nr:hypothetical protein Golomagni_03813 [Golovinomyces magnicellulatus]
MPKSKRAKVVHLSQVEKKGKELSRKLFANVRNCLDNYAFCWVYSVEAMRNTFLKDIRHELSDSRLFFGKTKVMAKALGLTPEEAYMEKIDQLATHLNGNVGLLFTNREPAFIIKFFQNLSKTDYARAGTISNREFIVPAGVVMSRGGEIDEDEDVPMAHSLEPELRKLGMPTNLVIGKIMLQNDYIVCQEGIVLDSRQTRLLKLFGVTMAEFKISLRAYWSSANEVVTQFNSIVE